MAERWQPTIGKPCVIVLKDERKVQCIYRGKTSVGSPATEQDGQRTRTAAYRYEQDGANATMIMAEVADILQPSKGRTRADIATDTQAAKASDSSAKASAK